MTGRAARTARRAWRAVLDFLAVQEELHARAALQSRPWEQEFLHWSPAGELHGSLIPPAGRRRSATLQVGQPNSGVRRGVRPRTR